MTDVKKIWDKYGADVMNHAGYKLVLPAPSGYKVTGEFRYPKLGEHYLGNAGSAYYRASTLGYYAPAIILRKVKPVVSFVPTKPEDFACGESVYVETTNGEFVVASGGRTLDFIYRRVEK